MIHCKKLFNIFERNVSVVNSACFSITPCAFDSKNSLVRKPIRVVDSYENKKRIFSLSEISETTSIFPAPGQRAVRIRDGIGVPFPVYIKLKDDDERFTKTLTMLKSTKERDQTGSILLEGVRLINDAISAGLQLKTIYFSKEESLAKINPKGLEGANIYKVLYRTLQVWSGLDTCPGIMGVMKKPSLDELSVKNETVIPVTVFCINIKDHGTMGSIVRSAAASGCRAIVTTKDCFDVWSHKVLRSGSGGHFRIPIIHNIEWTHALNYISKEASVYLVDSFNQGVNAGSTDSELLEEDFDFESELQNENEMKYREKTESGDSVLIDESYNDYKIMKKFKNITVEKLAYDDVIFPKNDIVLCIDGNYPSSVQTNRLMCEFGGQKLHVPVESRTQHLNPSLSLPIVLYEIRKQFTETYIVQ